MLDKNLVKIRFRKNLKTYDNSALIQRKMADVLVSKIIHHCGNKFGKIFEFGVGTGFLTKVLIPKIDFNEYCANDIMEEAQDYVKKIIRNAKFLFGDIESLPLEEKFDLIISNAVMQWVLDAEELLSKIRYSLNEEGYFAFTTFGESNYREIKETTGLSLNYLKSDRLKQLCEKDFELLYFEEDVVTLYFDSPISVLKHIKHSGTNGLKPLSWTYSKLKNFEKFYKDNFSENSQVKLTYNPIYMVLKARSQ